MTNHDRHSRTRLGVYEFACAFLLGLAIMAGPSWAQDTTPETAPRLRVELNTVAEIDTGCRMIFMAHNTLESDINALVLEAVLFTKAGDVERLTLLDFQDLPRGRPRVRQFDFAGPSCEGLGRILINGVHACTGGLEAATCSDSLYLESRTDHEVLG